MADQVFRDPPALIGHRGFGKNAEGRPAENTIASMTAAVDAGIDWIEFDVRRTADDRLVVLHDPATEDGTLVVTHTAAELAACGIVTLDEVLEAVPESVGLDVEVKPAAEDAGLPLGRGAAGLLTPVLDRERDRRPWLASSFDPSVLVYLREALPGFPLGLITWLGYPLDMAVTAARHLGAQVLMAHTASYGVPSSPSRRTPEDVCAIASGAGLELAVWSPAPEEIAGYLDLGVTGVTVDDVPGALAAVGRTTPAGAG